MHKDILLKEMIKALDDEILYLKKYGEVSKFVCKNGVLIKNHEDQYVYEFILENPIIFQEDTPISINYGGQTIIGSIAKIEGVKIIIVINQFIGDKVPEIIVIANPYFLLEKLKEKLLEVKEKSDLPFKVLGERKAQIGRVYEFRSDRSNNLNEEQKEALAKSLGSEVIFIWGPPGTGKTHTLVQIIEELILRNKSVLLVSHTNIAVDNAIERLAKNLKEDKNEYYFNGMILRIGMPHINRLFKDFPELNIAHWIEEKSKNLKEELNELIKQKEEKERLMNLYKKIIILMDKFNYEKKESEIIAMQIEKLKERKARLELSIKDLNQEKNILNEKLLLAKTMNPVQRFLRGLIISKLNQRLNEIIETIQNSEVELENTKSELKELQMKSYQLQESINYISNQINNYFKILGNSYPKEKILNEADFLQNQLDDLNKSINNLNEILSNIEKEIISKAIVIGTTLTKVYLDKNINERLFDVLIIDEASIAPIPTIFFSSCLIKEKVIIIGDFKQLAPIAQSDTQEVTKWLKKDIFEVVGITKNIEEGQIDERVVQLREQRRMPEEIIKLVNEIIYYNTLKTGEKNTEEKNIELFVLKSEPFPNKRIIICDTSNINPWSSRDPKGSPFNIYNAFLSVEIAKLAIKNGINDIGIITPYSAQSRLIHKIVISEEELVKSAIDPSSVHRFQGREKQLIIFDLVEGPVRKIKWLNGNEKSDAARLVNVAITRTKAKLIFIANLNYLNRNLTQNSVLKKIIDKAKTKAEIVDSRNFFDFIDIEKKRKNFMICCIILLFIASFIFMSNSGKI